MTNWAIFPSGNSVAAAECVAAWRDAGWRVGVLIDADQTAVSCDQLVIESHYAGTGASFNTLIRSIQRYEWSVVACVNDDMFPDRCEGDFAEYLLRQAFSGGTCGVVQPTGRWYDAMKWCAPSPIIGREYIARFPQGVFYSGYYHLYVDQELRDVAIRNGCYAETKSLGIDHRHKSMGHPDRLPPEKREKNNARHRADAELYEKRLRTGFPL